MDPRYWRCRVIPPNESALLPGPIDRCEARCFDSNGNPFPGRTGGGEGIETSSVDAVHHGGADAARPAVWRFLAAGRLAVDVAGARAEGIVHPGSPGRSVGTDPPDHPFTAGEVNPDVFIEWQQKLPRACRGVPSLGM